MCTNTKLFPVYLIAKYTAQQLTPGWLHVLIKTLLIFIFDTYQKFISQFNTQSIFYSRLTSQVILAVLHYSNFQLKKC